MSTSRSRLRFSFVIVVALVLGLLPAASQAQQPDPRCSEPGVTILEDTVGDTNPQTGNPATDDIERLSIAEPGSLGPGKIMFILKMASLPATLPGDVAGRRTWPVTINNAADPSVPDPTMPTDNFVVRMSTFPLGPPPTFSAAPGTSPNPVTNPGTSADPASSYATDGTIRIIVSRSQIGNPMPGQTISNFLVRIRIHGGAVDLTPDNMPDDLIPVGDYMLIGSENCVTNRAPIANPDTATTKPATPVTINVLANDSDPDGDPLTVTTVTDPPRGTATRNADNTVTYRPDCGFTGTDMFTYTISDGRGGTASALVTVTVRRTSRRGSC
jgi:Bacterial Ig domain